MGGGDKASLRLQFNPKVRLEFHGSIITSDAGLFSLRELDEALALTSLQTRMIKTGGRLVRHARRLVFQLAEVLVRREMLAGILERIGQLRSVPG